MMKPKFLYSIGIFLLVGGIVGGYVALFPQYAEKIESTPRRTVIMTPSGPLQEITSQNITSVNGSVTIAVDTVQNPYMVGDLYFREYSGVFQQSTSLSGGWEGISSSGESGSFRGITTLSGGSFTPTSAQVTGWHYQCTGAVSIYLNPPASGQPGEVLISNIGGNTVSIYNNEAPTSPWMFFNNQNGIRLYSSTEMNWIRLMYIPEDVKTEDRSYWADIGYKSTWSVQIPQ